jgi:pimeloyl-ACP methyl ester carboxylesterase
MKHALLSAALTGAALLTTGCATPATETVAEAAPAYDAAYPPSIEELSFQSGGDRLNGLIYLADGPGPHPGVVLLHGFPGNEKNLDLAQDLRSDGFNVLFFHYRGAWGSEGDYTLIHVIEDVAAATDYLRANAETFRTDPDKIILVGHSMGGFAALQGAAQDARISCVAGIAPADMGANAAAFEASPEAMAGFMAYSDSLQMLHGLTGEKIVAEVKANREAFDLRALAPKLEGKSVLLIGGDKDTSVPVDRVMNPLIAAYEADKAIDTTAVILSGDHSFSWSRHDLIATVIDWAEGCR